ncbi:hypothetical protein ACVW1C_000064 [Bradyrhizobium sp. USDA 4011]
MLKLLVPVLFGGLAVGGITVFSLGGVQIFVGQAPQQPRLPQTGPYQGPIDNPAGNARGLQDFLSDCRANGGTVYTASQWNAAQPGANLRDGALHCHRPATIITKQE